MTTDVNIIRVGNSSGIIIPARFMKALRLKEKDRVVISESDGVLNIRRMESLGESPFSVLDKWNKEHNYTTDSLESVPEYIKTLRSSRNNKDTTIW